MLSRFVFVVVAILVGTLLGCRPGTGVVGKPQVSSGERPSPSLATGISAERETATSVVRLTNGEWPPYLSEELDHYGIASRIVSEAFASEGIEVEYGFFPWKRSLELARSGEWDGSLVWLSTPDRERDFYLSDPVIRSSYVFWHRKDFEFDWARIEDLRGVKVGGTRGYFYEEIFNRLEAEGQITVEWLSNDEQNFAKLAAGRIDLFPQDIYVGKEMLLRSFSAEEATKLTYHPNPIRVDDMSLLLSKQVAENERLINLFNKGLQRLRASGKLDVYLAEALKGLKEVQR